MTAAPTSEKLLNRRDLIIIVSVIVGLLIAVGVWGRLSQLSAATDTPTTTYVPASTSTVVRYEVTGSAPSAGLTLQTPTGSTQEDVDIPLTAQADGQPGLRMTGFSSGAFLHIAAQNQGETGSVTCRIVAGDQVISENTATAAYGIATCQGTMP